MKNRTLCAFSIRRQVLIFRQSILVLQSSTLGSSRLRPYVRVAIFWCATKRPAADTRDRWNFFNAIEVGGWLNTSPRGWLRRDRTRASGCGFEGRGRWFHSSGLALLRDVHVDSGAFLYFDILTMLVCQSVLYSKTTISLLWNVEINFR
jgi:polygalacturonase